MLRLLLLLPILVPVIALAQPAAPAPSTGGRVVLVAIDPELTRAIDTSLAPWGVEIVSVEGEAPASMPLAADTGRAIAEAQHADGVVWISSSDAGPALWVYDAATERSLARALSSPPPFDEPTAAAVALTLKALLRHSAVAPIAERAAPPPPPAPPEPPPPPAPLPPRVVHLELGAGLGAFATAPSDLEPRISLAISLWPAELSGILGFSLGARGGPGIGFHAADANGRWTSTSLALGVRIRGDLGLVDLGLGVEAGIAISTLDASLGEGREAHVLRVGFGGAAWGELGIRPDPAVRVAVRGGTTVSLPYERYVQRGELVLDVSPAALLAEVLVSLSFS